MSDQIKNSFDKVTIIKVLKGALIAATGTAALFILNWLGGVDVGNPLLTGLIAWAVPTLTNLIKEWMKGK